MLSSVITLSKLHAYTINFSNSIGLSAKLSPKNNSACEISSRMIAVLNWKVIEVHFVSYCWQFPFYSQTVLSNISIAFCSSTLETFQWWEILSFQKKITAPLNLHLRDVNPGLSTKMNKVNNWTAKSYVSITQEVGVSSNLYFRWNR